MIPISLQLSNFLSYGEAVPPLDFTAFKLACLTGRNGHGKSALLDAMTWAVWGEARKAGYNRTPDADLLRQNAEEMSVELTFLLNGHEYQVYREYHRKRRSTKLEFRTREHHDGRFILLTGNSKKDTQQRINKILGLDYRTFVNSSFLQQGKADEFTRQPPKERKDILCNILGLDHYDDLLEETKRRFSEIRAERKSLDENMETIQQELVDEETIVMEEKRLRESVSQQETLLGTLRSESKEIQSQIAVLDRIRERVERGREEEARIGKRLNDLSQRNEKLQKEISDATQLLGNEKEIGDRFQRHERIGRELHDLLAMDEQYRLLDTQRRNFEKSIESHRSALQVQQASLRSEYDQIQKNRLTVKPLLDACSQIEQRYTLFQTTLSEYKRLEGVKPAYDTLRKQALEIEKKIDRERQMIAEQIAELRGSTQVIPAMLLGIERDKTLLKQYPILQSEVEQVNLELKSLIEQGQENNRAKERAASDHDQCKRSLKETLEKLDLLQSGQSRECPLCNSELDPLKKTKLLFRLQSDIATTQAKIVELQQQIKTCEKIREDLLHQHQRTEKKRSEKERELSRLQLIEKNLQIQIEELKQKQMQEDRLRTLNEKLEQNRFAEEFRSEWERIQQELGKIAFDPERYEKIAQQLHEQRDFEIRWNQLQDTLQRQESWQKREREIEPAIRSLQIQLETEDFSQSERQSLQQCKEQMAPLQEAISRRKSLQEEQQRLRNAPTEWNQVIQARERLPELQKDLGQYRQDREELQRRLKEIADERERAVPSLEELAVWQRKLHDRELAIINRETERNTLQIQLGGIRQKLDYLRKRREEWQAKQEKIKDLERDERLYKILTVAFSRNGIPALILEQVLPELQNDANSLLHRLSGGTCSIALESQRETRSGAMSETLDIKISDEMGTRDYEMFSGGEAFRTDLALRIALSQLLCRRAGSKLQLLVIDEGFGTQDNEGINNIVDAINEIQDEFEMILMVTHLEELKERFQVRIEVIKELGMGSRFEIVHAL